MSNYLAKIAVECKSSSIPIAMGNGGGQLLKRPLARGNGWSVSDVVCSAGPYDRPAEEQHSGVSIAIVTAGSFQYRSTAGRELMTPGSLLLGNAGQYFECGHEHAVGDRCISFAYEPRYLENLAHEAGVRTRTARFSALRVPPVREFSALVARACASLAKSDFKAGEQHRPNATFTMLHNKCWAQAGVNLSEWEEIGIELAVGALKFASERRTNCGSLPAAEARVTWIIRMIERLSEEDLGLSALAREAKLSRYHFLRMFQQFTGLTPHQYVRRVRLRRAATQLLLTPKPVVDIALNSGFGDVSNFNHAFLAEFGVSPRSYRKDVRGGERKAQSIARASGEMSPGAGI
jgi:AraC family transcriptional regulator